ncbi:MAG: PKD domain-containing protein [Bacteroidetes bacterium]|nr:PKD domain-containing protein [Bacteroidota bacterium]
MKRNQTIFHCLRTTAALLVFGAIPFISLAQPTARFSADTTKGCAPVTIHFKDQSTGSGLHYLWIFGNGNVSTLPNPQAIYYLPGRYDVSLTITDSAGKQSTKTISQYIQVFKNPVADFTGDPLSGCIPLTTTFKNLSKPGDGKVTDFIWDFGDGNTKKDSIGKHTYTTQGKFNVSLVVTDINKCKDKKFIPLYIEVLPSPDPQISADKKFDCEPPLTVQFTNNTPGLQSSDTYEWNFGDGSKSTSKDPSHTYTQKGKFDVSLRVTKANGCTMEKIFPGYIIIDDLKPDFVANKTKACAPSEIKFTNTTQPTRDGVDFKWTFGDGGVAHTPDDAYHKYTAAGKYDVTLEVSYNGKCKTSITKPAYIEIQDAPDASFTMSDSIACKVPASTLLTNTSKNYSEFQWLINGQKGLDQSTLYQTFYKEDDYEIKLITKNFLGCTDTAVKVFKIEKPELELMPSTTNGCAPTPISFKTKIETFDEVTDYDWVFEKGKHEQTTTESTSHTFQNAGTYQVILNITTKSGCKASDTVDIHIGLKTNPSFAEGKDTLCNNEKITFQNTTNSNGVPVDSWQWKLATDDNIGTFSTEVNGELKTKHKPGTYSLMLISENNGCFDTITEADKITILAPLADFETGGMGSCNADTLLRINSTLGADSFVWNIYYPNGIRREQSWEQQLRFTRDYMNNVLELLAFNSKTGCEDSKKDTLKFPEITTRASIARTGSLCAPSSFTFTAKDADNVQIYTWYTEDDSLIGPQQIIDYPAPGDYSILLKVENPSNGCVDSLRTSFTVTGPEVSGELSGKEGCAPLNIKLQCNSDPKNYKELYWLIDTTKIPVKNIGTINYTLLKPGPESDGSYKIKLIGKDSNGCAGYQVFPIKVKGVIGADIKIRRITNCSGRHFIFEAVTPGFDPDKLGIEWDFGDGTTSTEPIKNKDYDADGKYNLVLKITNPATGCVTQIDKLIDIDKEKLIPKFTADSLKTECPPLFVKFRDLSTTAPGRYVTKWLWDFGDGSTSSEKDPSKLYLFPGNYTVTLKVEDENHCRDSIVFKDFVLVSGPQGGFNFDKKTGCAPLEVKFTGWAKDAVKTEFDMGDGTVYKDVLNFTHIYKLPGRYIPVLVLTDSFGCTFTHPPIDTIFVFDHPKPRFNTVGVCMGNPISFTPVNGENDGKIEHYEWEFTQDKHIQTSTETNPVITFNGYEMPLIKLTTTNEAGCTGTYEGPAELSRLKADFETTGKFNCVGNEIKLSSSTTSDTSIEIYHWIIGDDHFYTPDVVFHADTIGPKQIRLMVSNSMGCHDTIESEKLIIGDTIPPLNVEILRVTVNDDYTVQLDLKPSPAADFNSYEIFKEQESGYRKLWSVEDRKKISYLENSNNTLEEVYCYKALQTNACGLLSDSMQAIKHCTVESKAKGEVNRAVVSWNTYSGWQNISGYDVLREDLDEPGSFFKIGSTSADETEFIDSNIVCRVEHTYKIKAIESAGNLQISFSDTCKARPIWKVKPDPNELIRATVENDKFIRIEWDSSYYPRIPIETYVLQRSDDGDYYPLTWTFNADKFDFEDHKVKVDDQSYFYRTYAIDKCRDTSDIWNFGKTILLHADTTAEQRPMLTWSKYQGWDAGVDYYHVEIKNPDGSFSFIGQTASTDTMLVDMITNLNQRPNYCYRIVGYRNYVDGKPQVVSVSNEDCSPVYSRLYVPNAFTPNSDNINEGFGTPGIYIHEYHMSIYTRWGEKIWETYNMDEKWDGTYDGKPAQMDVYAVIVESIGVDRVRRVHYGTITLLR